MNLTQDHSRVRIAVRPFPSSPWVTALIEKIEDKLRKTIRSIIRESDGPEYDPEQYGLGYNSAPIWEGEVTSGIAKGVLLRIYLSLDRSTEGRMSGGKIVYSSNVGTSYIQYADVHIYSYLPYSSYDLNSYLQDGDAIDDILQSMHHELIHLEDPKTWKLYEAKLLGQRGGGGTSQYYRYPDEKSAFEGQPYFYFKGASGRGIPLETAIKTYVKKFEGFGYLQEIKKTPRLWREYLERLYKTADKAYSDSKDVE